MNHYESALSAALHDAVGEPPHAIEPQQLLAVGRRRSRRPRLIAGVAAVTVVLAVVVGVGLIVSRSRGQGAAHQPSTTRAETTKTAEPAELSGRTWTLTRLRTLANPAGVQPTTAVAFRFGERLPLGSGTDGATGIRWGDCGLAVVRVHSATMTIVQQFLFTTTSNCGPQLSVDQANAVGRVFTRTVSWSIADHVLTITNPAVGSVEFSAS